MNIIVTGASRGIGFAILEKFASQGWNIAFCSKNPESVQSAKNYFLHHFPKINVYAEAVNMSDKSSVISFAKNCIAQFGSVDVLVNNAGVFVQGQLSASHDEDALELLMQTNLYSVYWMGKEVIPKMISNGRGHIFNISSIAGIREYDSGGAYTVSKFALTGYTRQLRHELKHKNIRVTGVYPGAVLTDSWSGVDLPSSRFIAPNDIAELVYTTHHLSPSSCVEDIILRPTEGDI